MDPLQIGPGEGDRQAPVLSSWMYRGVVLDPLTAFTPFEIPSSKPSRMHDLPMCITSADSAGVTTGAHLCLCLAQKPGDDALARHPVIAMLNLPVLETRQGSPQSLLSNSSHQLLKPKIILHPHLSYTPGLPYAGRRCV